MLDSGCSNHMTGERRLFHTLQEFEVPVEKITFGDDNHGNVTGLGKIAISNDSSISNV